MRGTARTVFNGLMSALVLACSSTSRNRVDEVEVEVSGGAAGETATLTSADASAVGSGGASAGSGGASAGNGGSGGTRAFGGEAGDAGNVGDVGDGSEMATSGNDAPNTSTITGNTTSGAISTTDGAGDGGGTATTDDSSSTGDSGSTDDAGTTTDDSSSTDDSSTGDSSTTDDAGTTADATSSTTGTGGGGESSSTTDSGGAGGTVATDTGGSGGGGSGGTGPTCPVCVDATPVCLEGACVSCSPNPTPSSCEDQVPQYCDEDGHWQPASGACSNGETCDDGQCVCEFTECGSTCADTATDPDHCGACGHACQTGDCIEGKCEPETLASSRAEPWGIAVTETYLYWVERGTGILYRMTLADGSASPLSIVDWQCVDALGSVAVDTSYVYWEGFYVCRQPHGGGADEALGEPLWTGHNSVLSSGPNIAMNSTSVYAINYFDNWLPSLDQGIYPSLQATVRSIAADDAGLYWLELSATKGDRVMRTDPTSIDSGEFSIASAFDVPQAIAVHGGRVYWTERTSDADPTGSVYSVSTAGGPIQTIASDQDNPTAIAVDTSGVYWVNGSATEGEVMRASLLGGDAEAIATEQAGPHALALNSSAVYWTNAEGGEIMKLAK